MKILFAESKDRSDVFRKIFETDIYNLMTKKLIDRQKEYKENLKELKNTFVTNSANIIWEDVPSVITGVSSKDLNRLDIEEILELLEKEIEKNREDYSLLSEQYEVTGKDYKKLEEKIKNQIEINNSFDKYDKLLLVQKELESKKEEIELQKSFVIKNQKILAAVLPKEEKLLELEKELEKLEKDLNDLNVKIEKGKVKEKENLEKEKKIEKIKKAVFHYKELDEKYNDLNIQKNKVLELDKINKNKEKLVEKYDEISKEYKDGYNHYLEEEELFFKEQAGIIAEKIRENEPCPVCGSINHPCIAKKSEKVLSKENLEKLKEDCDNKQVEKNNIKNEITKLKSKYETLLSGIESSKDEGFKIEKYSKQLEKNISNILQKIEKLEKDASNLYLEICGRRLKIETFDYDVFKSDFEKNVKKEKEDLIKNQALVKELNSQKKDKDKKIVSSKKEYEKAYKALGFEDEAEYKKNVCSESELKNITKLIENYNKSVTENTVKISEIQKKIAGKEKNDVSEDKELLLELEKAVSEKKKSLLNLKGVLDNNRRMNTSLKNTSKELLEKIDEFVVLDELARTASGMLPGKRRIEFEQYVQSAYFDMIIMEANKRLSKMTENRYLLLRKENAEKASDRIGLDLEVLDNYNGKKRDVKSLSGGEAFKAALSLALGLSDIIQSYSGGVVIDTLFIDEGFGSLDQESREQAINTLASLIDGNKLIGIISHVTELKERIDKKIIVEKEKDGSIAHIEI